MKQLKVVAVEWSPRRYNIAGRDRNSIRVGEDGCTDISVQDRLCIIQLTGDRAVVISGDWILHGSVSESVEAVTVTDWNREETPCAANVGDQSFANTPHGDSVALAPDVQIDGAISSTIKTAQQTAPKKNKNRR